MNDDDIKDEVEEVFSREDLHEIVFAVCATLYKHGIREVHIGGLMRILGIEDEKASEHDDEIMLLDADFERAMRENGEDVVPGDTVDIKVPEGTTIH